MLISRRSIGLLILHCIILLLKASKNADFMTKHIIHCDLKPAKGRFHDGVYNTLHHIITKNQNKFNFTTEYIMQCNILLLKASKDANFVTEDFIHRDLKPAKCRFHDAVNYALHH